MKKKFNILFEQLMSNLLLEDQQSKKKQMAKRWPNASQQQLKQAAKLAERYHLDFQKFKTPQQLMDSIASRIATSTAKQNRVHPDTIKEFSHKVDHGDGIITYQVEDSKKG